MRAPSRRFTSSWLFNARTTMRPPKRAAPRSRAPRQASPWADRPSFPWSIDQPRPHGVDEVGVGRLTPRLPHCHCDLPAVVPAMNHYVGQDVARAAGPELTFAV